MITLLRLLEELNEIMNRKHRTQKKVLITDHCRHQPLLQTRLWDPFLCALSILLFSEPIFRKWRIAKHTINWLRILDIIPPADRFCDHWSIKYEEPWTSKMFPQERQTFIRNVTPFYTASSPIFSSTTEISVFKNPDRDCFLGTQNDRWKAQEKVSLPFWKHAFPVTSFKSIPHHRKFLTGFHANEICIQNQTAMSHSVVLALFFA